MATGTGPARGQLHRRGLMLLATALMFGVAACNGSASGKADAERTIVFATQGLGAEGEATEAAVKEFERQNPNVTIKLLVLSPKADTAYQQLTERFSAGSDAPDVATLDVIWPATFAESGWITDLTRFNPATQNFFPGQVQAGTYNGRLYAVPWFINAEGLYYRTDLVPTPPKSPAELVRAAQTAIAKDPSLKHGLIFAGDRYEGVVTAFVNFLGAFGGQLDPENLNTDANRQALQFMRDLIYTSHITPQAVTGWQERDVQNEFLAGRAAFAMNWPYVFQLAEQSSSVVKGRTGWIPFPSNGTPAAALGGAMLAINAKSQQQDEAWKFIQFLTSDPVQIERAVSAGDPPAVPSAYNDQLYAKAPYFRQQKAVFQYAVPRPASPKYPQISGQIQTMLSAVLANQQSPGQALSNAAQQLASLR